MSIPLYYHGDIVKKILYNPSNINEAISLVCEEVKKTVPEDRISGIRIVFASPIVTARAPLWTPKIKKNPENVDRAIFFNDKYNYFDKETLPVENTGSLRDRICGK